MVGIIREQIVKKFRRSSGWRKVRNDFINKNPFCAVCSKKRFLQVHHVEDFSTKPELELDPNNLITLCGKHHILFGHLNYWKSINPEVIGDVVEWRIKITNRRT